MAWPALVRPLLEGDSLGYHLPNAAAWAHDGTLWLTTTRYWWYPGASELFAAGLFRIAGPFALPLAGTAASALLGQRLATWYARAGVVPWIAGALAAATATALVAGLQAADLRNDLWLAAFVLEISWALRYETRATGRSAALCALLKPYGFLYAAVALATGRAAPRSWLVAGLPFAFWVARDAFGWRGAQFPPASTAVAGLWTTTIAAHGIAGAETLTRALLADGPWSALLFGAGLALIVFGRDAGLRLTAAAALLVFLCEPFGFDNPLPQLATGSSLRYALPFLALGALGLIPFARRLPLALGCAALAFAVWDGVRIVAIFWRDTTGHGEAWVLALAFAALLLAALRPRIARVATPLLTLGLIAYAVVLAASHPVDYFNDAFSAPGARTQFFTWLNTHRPSALVAWNLRAGALVVVSPESRVLDGLERDPCGEAQRNHALLVAYVEPSGAASRRDEVRERALDCGPALYRDPLVLVVAPR